MNWQSGQPEISSLIVDTDGVPLVVHTAVNVLHQPPVIVPSPRPRLTTTPPPPIPRSRAHRAFVNWIRKHYDTWDYERIDGPWYYRDTNERATAALNSGSERWRYQKRLTGRDIVRHCDGAITIRSAPVKGPTIVIRIDADEHRGQTDADAMLQWFCDRYELASLYIERSENGCAAYAVVALPRLPWRGPASESPNGDGTYFEAAGKINRTIDAAQAALQKLTRAAGFAATIEINGRLDERRTEQLCNGQCSVSITRRGSTAKLPRCQGGDPDKQKLLASSLEWSVLHQIITDARALPDAVVQPAAQIPLEPQAQHSQRRANRNRRRVRQLNDSGDKHRNRCRAVSTVLQELARPYVSIVGSFDELPAELQQQILDRENHVYEQAGFATGPRDRARDRAFHRLNRLFFKQFDPSIRGGTSGDLWWDEDDVTAASKYIRSAGVSRKLLAKLRTTDGLRGPLNYCTIAIALCWIAKTCNTATRHYTAREFVPVASLINGMGYCGIRVNGTWARVVRQLLETHKLIRVDHSYSHGHWSRRMWLIGAARKLPFVSHLYAVEVKAEQDAIAEQQRQQYLGSRGGRSGSHQQEIYISLANVSWAHTEPLDDLPEDEFEVDLPSDDEWELVSNEMLENDFT